MDDTTLGAAVAGAGAAAAAVGGWLLKKRSTAKTAADQVTELLVEVVATQREKEKTTPGYDQHMRLTACEQRAMREAKQRAIALPADVRARLKKLLA